MRQWEPAPSRGLGPSGPPVEQPSRMRKKCCYSQRTGGQYVAVCSVSNSPLSQPFCNTFENKVWEVYFSKEVCSFVIIVDWVSAYICICIVVSQLYSIFTQVLYHRQDSLQTKYSWIENSFPSHRPFAIVLYTLPRNINGCPILKYVGHWVIKKRFIPLLEYFYDIISNSLLIYTNPTSWGCRIHRLHLCRSLRPHHHRQVSWILWLGVVAPDRVLSMGQIKQTICAHKWLMLNCDCYIAILETICLQKRAQARLRVSSTKYVYKTCIWNIYV